MRFFARFIFFFFLSPIFFAIFFLALPADILADGEFQTDYDVNYKVDESGKTEVIQTITLENKTANYYADRFELKIGSIKVEDVKAQDGIETIEPQVKFEKKLGTFVFSQK